MKSQLKSKNSRDFIKVKYESEGINKNKIINCKDLSLNEFVEKLIVSLDVPQQKNFKLFYQDHTKDPIKINQQEDYEEFTQNIEQLVLYLHETKDQNSDFRKHLKIITIEEFQAEKQKLNKVQFELKKIKENFDQNKVKTIDSKIKEKSQSLRKQLEEFKITLQKKTDKALADRFKQIQQGVDSTRNNNNCTFKHDIGCQSSLQCRYKKNIVGIRYRCVVCQINLCYKCAEQEFKGKQCVHDPTHPMIKVRDHKWDKKLQSIDLSMSFNKVQRQVKTEFSLQKRQNSGQQKIIMDLANILNWKYQQAREFRNKYPEMNFQQLVEKAFQ